MVSNLAQIVNAKISALYAANEKIIKTAAFLILLVMYVTSATGYSFGKLLWYDEIFTVYIARLSTSGDIWNALKNAVDANPPVYYLAVWLSRQFISDELIAARLPAMFGFGLMCVCVYRFVSTRLGTASGLAAALIPSLTSAYLYAYEARPYGLVMGFCSAALVCWQQASLGRWRRIALIGLAASIAVALLSHYYAAVFMMALAGGEIVRSVEQRRIDIAMWVGFLAGSAVLLICLPLIGSITKYIGIVVAQPATLGNAFVFYYGFLLNTFRFALLAFIFAGTIIMAVRALPNLRHVVPAHLIPRHEIVAALLVALYPFQIVGLSLTLTGTYNFRYALPAIIGVAILIAYSIHLLGQLHPAINRTATVLIAGLFCLTTAQSIPQLASGKIDALQSFDLLISDHSALPIAMPDHINYLQIQYYAAAHVSNRLVYLMNSDSATPNIDDLILSRLGTIAPIAVSDYTEFVHAHPKFLVYGRIARPWLWQRILADGGSICFINQSETESMYLVEMGK